MSVCLCASTVQSIPVLTQLTAMPLRVVTSLTTNRGSQVKCLHPRSATPLPRELAKICISIPGQEFDDLETVTLYTLLRCGNIWDTSVSFSAAYARCDILLHPRNICDGMGGFIQRLVTRRSDHASRMSVDSVQRHAHLLFHAPIHSSLQTL